MTTILIATLLLAAPPDAGGTAERSPGEILSRGAQGSAQPTAAIAPLAVPDGLSPGARAAWLRRETSASLRGEATSRPDRKASDHDRRVTTAEHEKSVRGLLALYRTLDDDTSLARDERKRLIAKVRVRLQRVSQLLREDASLAEKRAADRPDAVAPPAGFAEFLGQQLQQLGVGVGRAAAADPGDELLDVIKETIRPETWQENGGPGSAILFQRFGQVGRQVGRGVAGGVNVMQGGGFGPLAGAGGGAAGDDHGQELVDLIQQTIAPDSWDVNGGPGAIYYWRHLRVLVVRQTGEVHGNVGGVLGQLRQAGN